MAKAPAKSKEPSEEEEAPVDSAPAEGEAVKKGLPGKTLVLYGGAAFLVLLLAGGLGGYFLGMFDSATEEHAGGEHGNGKSAKGEHGEGEEGEHKTVFYDLPEILVNLNSAGKKETYLKIRIALELENAQTQTDLEPLMPRVVDNFQVFLREMRVEDLSGSAGMIRLKEEMLQRINLSVQPLKVQDVLFKEMLIQ
ncbi:MAG: flagellar basal body-associated FliL family protein [Alphaproteobacteria bacterium]